VFAVFFVPFVSAVDLFLAQQGGFICYRIPALLSIPGTNVSLVFVEGRNNASSLSACGDNTNVKSIVMRRSTDGGATWAAQKTLFDCACGSGYECGYPSAVYDRDTNTTWLMLSTGKGTMVSSSTDQGTTWATPTNTPILGLDSFAKNPSSGHGIQLTTLCPGDKTGRLILPWVCGAHSYAAGSDSLYHSCLVYSDDHGKSWVLGASSLNGTREHEVIQTANCQPGQSGGALYSNQRNYQGDANTLGYRAYSWSFNGGATFNVSGYDTALTEPVTSQWVGIVASVLRLPPQGSGTDVLVFSDPSEKDARANLTARISTDNAKTWGKNVSIHSGPGGYTDLQVLSNGQIGVAYENGQSNEPYFQRISFSTFSV